MLSLYIVLICSDSSNRPQSPVQRWNGLAANTDSQQEIAAFGLTHRFVWRGTQTAGIHRNTMIIQWNKTRWSPRTRMPTRMLRNRDSTNLSHFPANPLVGHPDLTHWGDTLVGHPCLTLLRNGLVRHSCLTLLFNTFVGHSCWTLL